MTLGLASLVSLAVLTFGLTLRDPVLGDRWHERLVLSAAWLVMGAAVAVWNPEESGWIGSGILLVACLGTLGRPALIMDRVIDESKLTESEGRRGAIGQVAIVVFIIIAAFITV